jgi:hypothetical protein
LILDDINIRYSLRPGDIGYISYLHGSIYSREYQYGAEFEVYVANGLIEFYESYDANRDCIWICELQTNCQLQLIYIRNTGLDLLKKNPPRTLENRLSNSDMI